MSILDINSALTTLGKLEITAQTTSTDASAAMKTIRD
jgi:uncharacterized membrane protein